MLAALCPIHQAREPLPITNPSERCGSPRDTPTTRASVSLRAASETLGYASVDLDSRRYRVKTEICSNVELYIREDRPRQRCVEAQLRSLDNGIIIVICPEFRVGGDVFDDLSAEIHIKDDVGMSAIVGTVPERVDLRDQQKGK